jgi:hypothetical protein
MKISIESTDQITEIKGVPVRHWLGTTERGIPVHVFVHLIAVHKDEDCSQFDAELREVDPPAGPRHLRLSQIL